MATKQIIDNEETIPFFPDHITTEFLVTVGIIVVVVILGLIGLFSPVGLQDPADSMITPDHVKPEWYFLALYQILKYIPKTTGALMPVLLVLLILLWPFIDRKTDTKKAMITRWIFVIAGSVLIIALTIWGEVS
jgi:quinol-cytochrome oxidoreductase complex cytochrome b subunit